MIDIWVEAWISRSGETARIKRASPTSWTITASTPASATNRMVVSRSSSSRGKARVLRVT